MADQFCLRWNNHQSTLISVFENLYMNESLTDCALGAEGKVLKAHKVVLSACSPYFEAMLRICPDKHPIIFLKDVNYSELQSMLDYMYRGEVNVSQHALNSFLKTAEALQIKGLTDQGGGGGLSSGEQVRTRVGARGSSRRSAHHDIDPETPGATVPVREESLSPPGKKRKKMVKTSVEDVPADCSTNDSNACDNSVGDAAPSTSDNVRLAPVRKTEPQDTPPITCKTEVADEPSEDVQDLTLDDDDEYSNMSRPGTSYGNNSQDFSWPMGGTPGGDKTQDEVFMAAQEAIINNSQNNTQEGSCIKYAPRKESPGSVLIISDPHEVCVVNIGEDKGRLSEGKSGTQTSPPPLRVHNFDLSNSTTLSVIPKANTNKVTKNLGIKKQQPVPDEDPLKEAAAAVAKDLPLPSIKKKNSISKLKSGQLNPVKLRWKQLIASAKAKIASKSSVLATKKRGIIQQISSERIRLKQHAAPKKKSPPIEDPPAKPKKKSKKPKKTKKVIEKQKEKKKKEPAKLVSARSIVDQFRNSNPQPVVKETATKKKKSKLKPDSNSPCEKTLSLGITPTEEHNSAEYPTTPSVIVKLSKDLIAPHLIQTGTPTQGDQPLSSAVTQSSQPAIPPSGPSNDSKATVTGTPPVTDFHPGIKKIHDYNRSNKCPKCGRTYARWDSLKRHLDYQCGKEMSLSCPHCPFKSHLKCNLKRHIRRLHPRSSSSEPSSSNSS